MKALIELHGGKNLGAVSGNADYLLAGANMGPAKLAKATKLGVKIISESDFEQMISQSKHMGRKIGPYAEAEIMDAGNNEPEQDINSPKQASLFD